MTHPKVTLALTVLTAFSCYGNNADSIFDLSLAELSKITVVTAAAGFEQQSSKAPANVTVITAEQWQAMGARTFADVLRTIPGVHLSKSIQYDHNAIIFRGLSGNSSSKIKVLIDGEPINSLQDSGSHSGFQLPLTSFKRIEIVLGPGSVVYGADAFAGVINLVSYDFDEMSSAFTARAGSFDTYDFSLRHNVDFGPSTFQLSLDYLESADDNERIITTDLQSILDTVFGTSASNAPGRIDEHYRVFSGLAKWQRKNLALSFFTWRNFDLGLAAGIAQALDTKGHSSVRHDVYRLDYDLSEYITGSLDATLSYKEQDTQSFLYVFPAGTVLPIGADGNIDFVTPTTVTLFSDGYIGTPSPKGNSTTLRLTHLFEPADHHFIRWEVGAERQSFRATEEKNFGPGILNGIELVVDGKLTSVTNTPYIYIEDVSRDFYYLSLQDEWQINQELQATLGVRYDNYSDFGSTLNPRVAFIWQATESLNLKLFAGSAFQSPSVEQLYAQNNPVGLGNKTLQPETVDTVESGLNLEYFIDDNTLVAMSVFRFHAKDIVQFVFDETRKGNVAQNIGQQKGHGGEVSFKWKPMDNMTINANYSLLSLKDEYDNNVADVPKQMAYLAMNWKVSDNWNWNLDAKWIGERLRGASDLRANVAQYTWISTKLERRELIDNLSAAIIVNNLFDTDAREPSSVNISDDIPLPGRQVLFELNYQF
ncbi:hypothetical protein tinsulaeT_12840 [Thalassotalea insulae]|uniref:TonB-dependent receptor n=1 Tax=Thalassotalea insulae TaxID=2056778 RepID=A0ABQ6GRG9_9GAMM|nr:TonB-dependent receptor [Thalassotalea insulae]GLX77944.1 hypothetical protein tinsulaeT_12840 [Thalassotalea insulae]